MPPPSSAPSSPPRTAVLFDIDGTLVDSNYLHVSAWRRAFVAHGYDVPSASIHRHIGQGSGQLMGDLIGHSDDAVKAAWREGFTELRPEVQVLPGVRDLLKDLADRGVAVVLATSSEPEDVEALIEAIDVGDAVTGVTDSGDVDEAKPDPEVFEKALELAGCGAGSAIAVGDTVWDVAAARRAGLDCIGLTTGGISAAELLEAGAVAVYGSAAELHEALERGPLGRLLPARA